VKPEDLGDINGQPIDQAMLDNFVATFERDWDDSEIIVQPTEYGKALQALQSLELSPVEIVALERRAIHERTPLPVYLRSILQNVLC